MLPMLTAFVKQILYATRTHSSMCDINEITLSYLQLSQTETTGGSGMLPPMMIANHQRGCNSVPLINNMSIARPVQRFHECGKKRIAHADDAFDFSRYFCVDFCGAVLFISVNLCCRFFCIIHYNNSHLLHAIWLAGT